MDEKEKKLREDLEFHLDTLRRNLEVVSMEDLKAKYAKPFKDLKDNICKTATAYTQYISLGGIRVKSRYGDEAVKYINEAIKDTPYLKKISEAAFERQDMDEIAALARQLREVVLQSLHVFILPIYQRFFFNRTGKVWLGAIVCCLIFIMMTTSATVIYVPVT